LESKIPVGITIDPWQEASRTKSVQSVFNKVLSILRDAMIHDVHVHWNVHKVPNEDVQRCFYKVLREIKQKFKENVVFITPEVLADKISRLKHLLEVLYGEAKT